MTSVARSASVGMLSIRVPSRSHSNALGRGSWAGCGARAIPGDCRGEMPDDRGYMAERGEEQASVQSLLRYKYVNRLWMTDGGCPTFNTAPVTFRQVHPSLSGSPGGRCLVWFPQALPLISPSKPDAHRADPALRQPHPARRRQTNR